MLKVVGASWMKIRMSTWIIGIVLVLGIVVVLVGQVGQLEQDGNYSATAYWNEETGFEIKFWGQGLNMKKIPKGVASAYFQPHIETTGWAIIDVETQSDYPDWVQAYAAGMLEGSLSWQLIYWHWKNTVQNLCANQQLFCNYVRNYLEENLASVKKLCENGNDPYWHQIYLLYTQLEGLRQGFEHGVKRSRQTIEELENIDFLWMNAISDIVDLEYKFYDSKPNFSQILAETSSTESVSIRKFRAFRSVDQQADENLHRQDPKEHEKANKRFSVSCSAVTGSSLVKFSPENNELFVAHNTAGPYVLMLRMIKNYHFRYHRSATDFLRIENKLTFSSYPAAIHSMDDFYVISNGDRYTRMIVAGTPITVFNKALWKFVSPLGQVLTGLRTVVASRLSDNGSTWTSYLSKYNSGTGNKQWMVVDVKKFKNDCQSQNTKEESHVRKFRNVTDILWVAEQIPGLFVRADQTEILKNQTYWANYGLPFYESVTDLSGTKHMNEIFGDAFSNVSSPLAKIYMRDHFKVRSIKDLMKLMRSNSYKKDPYSLGNPRCAIGARGDIPTELYYTLPIGVIDSKVFSTEKRSSKCDGMRTNITALNNGTVDKGSASEERRFLAVAGPAHSLLRATDEKEIPSAENKGETMEQTEKMAARVPDAQVVADRHEEILRPFDWTESLFNGFPHHGHPDTWNFEPIFLPL